MTTTPSLWGGPLTLTDDPTAYDAAIAPLASGGFATAWQRDGGGARDIAGLRFTPFGDPTGPDFLSVVSLSDVNLGNPRPVQLASGNLLTAFTYEYSGTDIDIYGTVATAPGFSAGSGFPIDGSGRNDVQLYEAEATPDGGATMLWQRSFGTRSTIILGHTDANGSPANAVDVAPASTESLSSGDLAVLGNGSTAVVWQAFDPVSLSTAIRLNVFNAGGTSISGELTLSFTDNPAFPVAEALPNGGFVVAWQDVGEGGIYHQVFSANGSAVTAPQFYNAGFSILPKVTALADGGYLLGWSDYSGTEGDGSPDGSITLQRFDATGQIVGRERIVNHPGDQTLQDLETLRDGRVVLTYQDETGDSTDVTRLRAQILDPRDSLILGSDDDDVIVGRIGSSTVRGYEGQDRLFGMGGDDRLLGGDGGDLLRGGGGEDRLFGGADADRLEGGRGRDTLDGGSGADLLLGGGRRDLLTGGGGADRFIYREADDSRNADGQFDVIRDFTRGADRIVLEPLDASPAPGDQDFRFMGTGGFTGTGQVRVAHANGDTIIYVNLSGGTRSEMAIHLDDDLSLRASDFDL